MNDLILVGIVWAWIFLIAFALTFPTTFVLWISATIGFILAIVFHKIINKGK